MIEKTDVQSLLSASSLNSELKQIGQKVIQGQRISDNETLTLFEQGDLAFLGALANYVREQKNGNKVFFNRNFHIEPTNVCVFSCKFCSYSRSYTHREDGWELSMDQMLDMVKKYDGQPVTEVHIVGGVHPKMNIHFFAELLQKIKAHRPDLHIKGFTAVELDYMIRKAGMTYEEGLKYLHDAGLDSLPGGGSEIFDEQIRAEICGDKCSSEVWLDIHRTAHLSGMQSNATILYGHVESYSHRIDHMSRLRQLQDDTKGFNTFIPLKFRNKDNEMAHVAEVSLIEDLKNYAVSRIYLDNFNHVKAYWPMIGRQVAQMSLSYGVDDIDGTIDDSTKIYSMAGAEEKTPTLTTEQLCELILDASRIPVERDTLYNVIKDYSKDLSEA